MPGEFRTYTGQWINTLSPMLDEITINDIAHSLALQCRFRGHCQYFYSNAQHSLLCVEIGGILDVSYVELAYLLLHDACESYLGDSITFDKKYEGYTDERDEVLTPKRAREEAVTRRILLRLYPGVPMTEWSKCLLMDHKAHDYAADLELRTIMKHPVEQSPHPWLYDERRGASMFEQIDGTRFHPKRVENQYRMELIEYEFLQMYTRIKELLAKAGSKKCQVRT